MNVRNAIARLNNEAKPWNSHRELLECTMVLQDSANVKTFCFQTADASLFRYLPGQFITLELEIDGEKVFRTYTLSSSPSRPLCLTITVKAQPGGRVSNWLHQNLKVGDFVKAHGPSGIFTFHNHVADKYLFLSGGVGITPVLSMTRWLFDFGTHTDVTFIHSAQTPSDILFRHELEMINARLPEFKVAFVCERADPYGAWTGYSGRLNQLMLELICPDYQEREVFCCGPEPYMRAVRDILRTSGFDMARYHEESFDVPVHDETETIERHDTVVDAQASAQVDFTVSGKKVSCRESDTLLSAAREAGLHIPSACMFGVCGTCKVKKTAGEVHMVHAGGISDEEIAEGYVLACCSNPLGEVAIEY